MVTYIKVTFPINPNKLPHSSLVQIFLLLEIHEKHWTIKNEALQNKTKQWKKTPKQLPAGFMLRQAIRCSANVSRAPHLVSFMKSNFSLCLEIAVSDQGMCLNRFIYTQNVLKSIITHRKFYHASKSTLHIMNISAINLSSHF